MPTVSDQLRIATAHTPLGSKLVFRELTGREMLSGMFEYRVELIAEDDAGIDPAALLGREITIEVETQGGGSRYVSGQCTRFAYAGREQASERNTTLWRYEARLRPWTWYMTRETDCRIFQNQTVPDILRHIFAKYPFAVDMRLTEPYRTWVYCVQYQETDYNFASRLMEHEGIRYWFEHALGEHVLVLADDIGAHATLPGYASIPCIPPDQLVKPDQEWIDEWHMAQEVQSGQYVTNDFDWEAPSSPLAVVQSKPQPFPNSEREIYEWPGGYVSTGDGERYARARIEEAQQRKELTSCRSSARGVAPGYLFTLEKCPRHDQNREYLILEVQSFLRNNPYHAGNQKPAEWLFDLHCLPTTLPYRPQRVTPKPRSTGPQTAVVVGPPDEEIFTNEHGEVKVQFWWDRNGLHDENSSCWIRVASSWAGNNWGQISLPRIGQEVIVDFLYGDLDQPIIIGRVYNAEHKTPYVLPRWKEYSTWKSRSTKHGGNNDWNEIRFYDYKGKEQVFIHCQWRMDVRVKWSKYETVKESSHFLCGHSLLHTCGGEYDLYAGKDIYTETKGATYSNSKSDLHVKAGGDAMLHVTAGKEINARSVTIEAAKSVVLKCAGSFIEVSPMGITIQGPLVRINSGGAATGTGPMKMGAPLHAQPADTGEPGYLDRPYRGGGGGGGDRWSTDEGYHSRDVVYDPSDGSFTYGGSGIKVVGSPDFADKTLQTLGGLDSTPTGRKLVDNLQSNGHTVTIREATPAEASRSGGGETTGNSFNVMPAGTYTDSAGNPQTSNGNGDDSTVAWTPGYNAQYNKKDPATGATTTETQPDEALLGHELNHADHNGRGNNIMNTPDPKDSTGNQEESQTIGINDHKDEDVTENKILKDLGEDWQRTDHDSNAVPLPK
jgi:type VI secretion system VgrG family protein